MAADVGPYSTSKLAFHPDVLEKLRRGEHQPPLLVQIFPTNVCPHSCRWCSFGSGPESVRATVPNPPRDQWKNQQLFGARDILPWEKLQETLSVLSAMGTPAVEISGGGEPMTYRRWEALIEQIAGYGFELGLVTNGTLMTEERADQLANVPFLWARVSIDAGTAEQYVQTRRVPVRHWELAWRAVELLAQRKTHPEARVGVGFVVDTGNWASIYAGCQLAKDAGADNVRLSLSFTPEGTGRWREHIDEASAQAERACAELNDATFTVHNLVSERRHNVELGRQEYPLCAWKDIGCVLGADSNVYACCSWAYSTAGRMFSIADQDFATGWFGKGAEWREKHDPRRDCRITCLYEARNVEALRLMTDRDYAATVASGPRPLHENFV